jgi:hypothetical protein
MWLHELKSRKIHTHPKWRIIPWRKQARTMNKTKKEDKGLSVEERNESIDDWILKIIRYLDLGFSVSVIKNL